MTRIGRRRTGAGALRFILVPLRNGASARDDHLGRDRAPALQEPPDVEPGAEIGGALERQVALLRGPTLGHRMRKDRLGRDPATGDVEQLESRRSPRAEPDRGTHAHARNEAQAAQRYPASSNRRRLDRRHRARGVDLLGDEADAIPRPAQIR